MIGNSEIRICKNGICTLAHVAARIVELNMGYM